MISSIANSLGFGSGIDTAKLVADLAAASRGPKAARIESLLKSTQSKISAITRTRSDLDSFSTSLADLVASGTLRTRPVSSNQDIVLAAALPGQAAATSPNEITVTQIAAGQSLISGYTAQSSDAVGTGTLTLTVNGQSHTILVDAGTNNIDSLALAINVTNSGVSARVATDAAGARLILKGSSGVQNAFELSASLDSEAALSRYTYPSSGAGFTLAQAARNAVVTVDGIPFERPNNTISDVIDGVSITLRGVTTGTPITLDYVPPTDAIKTAIADFVTVFNGVKANSADAKETNGAQQGLRALDRQLARLISHPVTANPRINSLSDLGVKTNRDGSLSVDQSRLTQVLRDDPAAVEAIFASDDDGEVETSSATGISAELARLAASFLVESGPLSGMTNGLEREIAALDAAKQRMEVRETVYRQRLERQFGSMDGRVAALKVTQSYLEQQIKIWSGN